MNPPIRRAKKIVKNQIILHWFCRILDQTWWSVLKEEVMQIRGLDWPHRLLNLEFGQVSNMKSSHWSYRVLDGEGGLLLFFSCKVLLSLSIENPEPWRIWSWFPTQGRQNTLVSLARQPLSTSNDIRESLDTYIFLFASEGWRLDTRIVDRIFPEEMYVQSWWWLWKYIDYNLDLQE